MIELVDEVRDSIFRRYGTYLTIEVNFLSDAGSSFRFSAEFYDQGLLQNFLKDIKKIELECDEEIIRNNNPTVQRAYEDYKLLIKLSK